VRPDKVLPNVTKKIKISAIILRSVWNR